MIIETAKTDKSKCYNCKEKINKGDLSLRIIIESNGYILCKYCGKAFIVSEIGLLNEKLNLLKEDLTNEKINQREHGERGNN